MLNLRSLVINLHGSMIDDYQCEELIRSYLPKLKKFRFTMKTYVDFSENVLERMSESIKPFRNAFWIAEHRCCVRCFA